MSDFARQALDISLTATATSTRESVRVAALVTGIMGVALLWAVGFAEIEVLHNIAHDTRHSNVFPCH